VTTGKDIQRAFAEAVNLDALNELDGPELDRILAILAKVPNGEKKGRRK